MIRSKFTFQGMDNTFHGERNEIHVVIYHADKKTKHLYSASVT